MEQHSLPGARFVDPKVLARIGNLELLAKTVVDGFINGLHRSPYFGASVDFAEHRGYMPGDDIRRVDWKLYARTDRYYLKEYEADTNANFSVILDISRSMDFSSRGISKLEYGKYLCACLAYFAQQQRDRIGCITFDSDIVTHIPPSAKHLDRVLHTLDRAKSERKGDLKVPMQKMAEHFGRRGILVIVSDWYEIAGGHHGRGQAAALPRQRPGRVPRARPVGDRFQLHRGGELSGSRDRRADSRRADGARRRSTARSCRSTSRR